jgi:ribonucleotide monophosphatase NagD (HAD superfamily)
MIGDNRETDITFGKNAGISTLCVLTGVTIE